MAYDKIIPIRSRLDHCVSYVLNPEKTDIGQALAYIGNLAKTITPDGRAVLQTGINCQVENAYAQMMKTKKRWGKLGGVLGYHLIHSYAPGEVTPEQAHALGLDFAKRLLGDEYEIVVSTHLDHDHLHNHILFNSVSFMDGHKFRDNFKAYYGDIRGISNAISKENRLSVITPEGTGMSYGEWNAEKHGKPTVRSLIRQDIDAALLGAFTFQSFLAGMKRQGYAVKVTQKNIALKPPYGERFIRLSSMGKGYTEDDIRMRLSQLRSTPDQRNITEQSKPQRRYTAYRHQKPFQRHKLRGFRALLVHYMILLGNPKVYRRKAIPFEIRKEVIRLHRYQEQLHLLGKYRVETDGQLSMLADALQANMDALSLERRGLYRKRKCGEEVSEQLQRINTMIREHRKELRLCRQITEDIPRIRQSLATLPVDDSEEKPSKVKKQFLERR